MELESFSLYWNCQFKDTFFPLQHLAFEKNTLLVQCYGYVAVLMLQPLFWLYFQNFRPNNPTVQYKSIDLAVNLVLSLEFVTSQRKQEASFHNGFDILFTFHNNLSVRNKKIISCRQKILVLANCAAVCVSVDLHSLVPGLAVQIRVLQHFGHHTGLVDSNMNTKPERLSCCNMEFSFNFEGSMPDYLLMPVLGSVHLWTLVHTCTSVQLYTQLYEV